MASGGNIDVSVTLLTRNAGPLLDRVLRAVRAQSTSRRVEIVAIDSGSSDGTLAVLAQHDVEVAQIRSRDFDFGRTRDQVFEMSRGNVIIALSQDAVPAHPRWLENLIAPLEDEAVAVSCGRSVPDTERDYAQFVWERNGLFYFTREMRQFSQRHGRGLSNANAAYKRAVWEKLKFGAQPIGEDFRFQTKLLAEGLRVAFPDSAEVLHHHAYTLSALYKRCRNEGLGLRTLGCALTEADLVRDFLRLDVHRAWWRELLRGNLRRPADFLFPVVRPCAVYVGSRFARRFAP
ncbi:MAG: glycosyltransferase family 2 protein [Candidatus Hydrogenedentes bacterium]|nr:glycosyltransferase family 2 protein [Candidatus Hydrogenedentota bacterium]